MNLPREAIGSNVSNCFPRGSYFLRKPTANCNYPGDGSVRTPCPPSGSAHVKYECSQDPLTIQSKDSHFIKQLRFKFLKRIIY